MHQVEFSTERSKHIRVEVSLSGLDVIMSKLDRILKAVKVLGNIMKTLDEVVEAVTQQTTAVDSLGVFVKELKQQVADALSGVTLPPAVQAKVDAIFTGVDSNKQKVVDAMAANVPPVDPNIPPVDPSGPVDTSGWAIDPVTGWPVDPATGQPKDPAKRR